MNSKEKLKSNIKKEILKFNSKLENLISLSKNYSLIRLCVFISIQIFFFGFYIYNYKITATVIGSILGIVFLVLMHNHSKIEKSIKRFKYYIQIKKEELARLELDWDNIPNLDNGFVNNPSDIEQDLNITDKHGLLQLISTGVSLESIAILREWLSGKSSNINNIVARQKIVSELKDLRRFRVKLLLITKLSIRTNIDKVELVEWIKSTTTKRGLKIYTLFLSLFASLNLFFLVGWIVGYFNTYYYQILLLYLFFYFAGYNYVKHIKDVSEFLYDEVRKYSSIFNFI
jgi:hypothetical protein